MVRPTFFDIGNIYIVMMMTTTTPTMIIIIVVVVVVIIIVIIIIVIVHHGLSAQLIFVVIFTGSQSDNGLFIKQCLMTTKIS